MSADLLGVGGLLALVAFILGVLLLVGAVAVTGLSVGASVVLLALAVLFTRALGRGRV